MTKIPALFLLSASLLIQVTANANNHSTKPMTFTAQSGESVEAIQGFFDSPVRHENPDGPKLRLSYIRFPSTNPNPGNPIIYLAGGPGGTGSDTARGARFPLFMALRAVADVIAFDQRGTGYSDQTTPCKREKSLRLDQPLSIDVIAAYDAEVAQFCLKQWRAQGHDVDAYNTWQSAGDLDVLRQVLGAEKLNLWGISYGTHLALATMKRSPSIVDRAVLASAEGLDQTVKQPLYSDRYFERVQEVINQQPEAKKRYPDLVAMMRRVHQQLNQKPVTVATLNPVNGDTIEIKIDASILQAIVSVGFVKNPPNVSRLPLLYAALEQGDTSLLSRIFPGLLQQLNADLRLMPLAMDVTSGITRERLDMVKRQAADAVLGNTLNYPMPHLLGKLDLQDLGSDFRKDPSFDGHVLMLTGTLDGRTFPEASRQILKGLKNGQHLIINNAGHDLFMVDPKVTETIVAFLARKALPYTEVTVEPPGF